MVFIDIPGDSRAVALGADDLNRVSETLRALARTLDRVADDDMTIGASVDAIRSRTVGAKKGVRAAEERYAAAADALSEFAVALDDIQSQHRSAQSAIAAVDEQIRGYQRQIWDLESDSLTLMMSMPDPAEQADRERRLRWLRAQLVDVRTERRSAVQQSDAALRDWHLAADRAAAGISPAMGALNDTVLDRVGAALDDLGEFFAAAGEWIDRFLAAVLGSLLILVIAVIAVTVVLALAISFLPLLLSLWSSGVMSLDEIVEGLVGVSLLVVPLLTPAIALLLVRESLTPTPTVTPYGDMLGGRLVRGDRSDYEYLFERNGELDEDGGRDRTVVEVVQILTADGSPALDENGNPIWRVTLPSTQDWQLIMEGAVGDGGAVNDLGSNLALILTPDQQTAYERAVIVAMQQAGIGPHDSVMLVGWSQGGILAGALASDPSVPFNVRAIVIAGAPIDHMPIPDSVNVIAIQHDGDHVPRLDGVPPRQQSNWVTLTESSRGDGYPHSADQYADTASRFDSDQCVADYPRLQSIRDNQSMFFSGTEMAYTWQFAERETALL